MRLQPKAAAEYIVKHAQHLSINEKGVEKIVDEVRRNFLHKPFINCVRTYSYILKEQYIPSSSISYHPHTKSHTHV